ncbi:hypothetical protein CEUSTIGMA_g4127.t1 [Chlamydomonas eustigma]|uniref:Uncharacterized protein n=1 Tax=Chlamydomonas eustigma TaxID=1157962 RepID=A0A250X0S4_9CHLO|nr:hypothetical protein CEUSTIGMA_g4127.t1 [Chlamydomonas eustigma]|eukprot:GAX76681.1 hypothetical protein CEUSTIGMA_g4127.t1 [Chlamydomonas eustigma]
MSLNIDDIRSYLLNFEAQKNEQNISIPTQPLAKEERTGEPDVKGVSWPPWQPPIPTGSPSVLKSSRPSTALARKGKPRLSAQAPKKKEAASTVASDMSRRPAGSLAASALITGAAEAGVTLPDEEVSLTLDQAPGDEPLPSIQTEAGRERLLQTPAFVIASHFISRGEPLSAVNRAEQLREQLKQAAVHQKKIVSEKMDVEHKLRQTSVAFAQASDENKVLRVKCDQLTDQVVALQRSLRDGKASMMAAQAFLSPRVRNVEAENLKRILRLEQQVENQQVEMDRLRAKLKQAGIDEY